VGWFWSTPHPFVWLPGFGLFQLGGLPGQAAGVANAINNSWVVVGQIGRSGPGGNLTAVQWDLKRGGVEDLNALCTNCAGWHLERAVDINNFGLILGVGKLNGVSRGVLLSPTNAGAQTAQQ